MSDNVDFGGELEELDLVLAENEMFQLDIYFCVGIIFIGTGYPGIKWIYSLQ